MTRTRLSVWTVSGGRVYPGVFMFALGHTLTKTIIKCTKINYIQKWRFIHAGKVQAVQGCRERQWDGGKEVHGWIGG